MCEPPKATKVIQVTNIAPQATRDQMVTLFSTLGVSIEDLRLYPSVRDAAVTVVSRCAFVKFSDANYVGIAQHLNNTVFIDRAIIISPVSDGEVPDEVLGIQLASSVSQNSGNANRAGAKMPPNVVNRIEGVAPHAYIITHDPKLEEEGLPAYPPLPANTVSDKVEEIRRTVCVVGLDSTVSAQQCMEVFTEAAGEVKYFRYCTRDDDPIKYALIEFTEQSSVAPALKMNDQPLGMSRIKVTHSLLAITKPQAKSNEAAQREIEEAMSKVKEAQSLVSAAVDPLMGMMMGVGNSGNTGRVTKSRSRSRSRRRSRSHGRSGYNGGRGSRGRSRSKERSSRSSRHKSRSRSRSRDRRRRSRDRHSRRRSRSRDKRKRSRSRDRKREKEGRRDDKEGEETDVAVAAAVEKNMEENGKEENGSSSRRKDKKRSRSRERKRSRSREKSKKRSRSKERKRSRSRESSRRKRSRSRESRRRKSKERSSRRSRSKDRSKEKKRSRSRERKKEDKSTAVTDSKVKIIERDYDMEEEGFESAVVLPSVKAMEEDTQEAEDMEISNSP